jgi:hypothetical protein
MKTVIFTLMGVAALAAPSQSVIYLGMGDSIGEGVQSGYANRWTQPWSYHAVIARQWGIDWPLPLIRTTPIGVVGEMLGRSRINPNLVSYNLS